MAWLGIGRQRAASSAFHTKCERHRAGTATTSITHMSSANWTRAAMTAFAVTQLAASAASHQTQTARTAQSSAARRTRAKVADNEIFGDLAAGDPALLWMK